MRGMLDGQDPHRKLLVLTASLVAVGGPLAHTLVLYDHEH